MALAIYGLVSFAASESDARANRCCEQWRRFRDEVARITKNSAPTTTGLTEHEGGKAPNISCNEWGGTGN